MSKLSLVLFLLLSVHEKALSQIEWKIFAGIDPMPVKTKGLYSDYFSGGSSLIEVEFKNQGFVGLSVSTGKKLYVELNLAFAQTRINYTESIIDTGFYYNNAYSFSGTDGNGIYRLALGCEIMDDLKTELFIGTYGYRYSFAGISIDKKFKGNYAVALNLYAPLTPNTSGADDILVTKLTAGVQVSYLINRKKRREKRKDNIEGGPQIL
jgi:hypothetical protein